MNSITRADNASKDHNNNPIQALFRNRFQSLSRSSSIPIHEIEYQQERDAVSIVTPTSSSRNQFQHTPFEQWSVTATDNTSIASTLDQSKDADIGEDSVLPLTPDKQKVQIPRMTEKIVLFPSDSLSFSEALQLWLTACNQLMTSDEMNRLLQCSGAVVCCAGELVVRTATLPVRVPILMTCGVIDVTVNLVKNTATIVAHAIESQSQSSGECSEEDNRGFLRTVFTLPGTVVGVASKVVLSLVAPMLESENDKKQQIHSTNNASFVGNEKSIHVPTNKNSSSSNYPDYLDRLRLDYEPKRVNVPHHIVEMVPSSKTSKYLLRVNDLGLSRSSQALFYIDLSPDHADQALIAEALDRMVNICFSFLANHDLCRLSSSSFQTYRSLEIHWSMEGHTKRILRKMGTDLPVLLSQTLVWSGKLRCNSGYGHQFSFFLARGAIPMSPRQLLNLLWDNTRTSEYNNFCLGRSTLLSIGDQDESCILRGAYYGTKVIKSEMRVPFTGLTVKAICLMHVRPIDDGFVIISRTLDSGTAGNHYNNRGVETSSSKNEILWGCNLIRAVHGNPNVCDLTSLSQIGSSVPNFLAAKIGLMGIEDFFKNVRGLCVHAKQ
jgi:hypothetical protein